MATPGLLVILVHLICVSEIYITQIKTNKQTNFKT